jgi:hypothetical protein
MTNNAAYVVNNQSSNITLTIAANDTTAPAIADTNVSPLIANAGTTITIYATATDNVQVSTCWASITLPNSSVVQKTDVCAAAATYITQIPGVHNVTFYANDTSGNTATSTSVTFIVDTTVPNLNSTSASVTASSSTISYATNESVNVSISYGLSLTSLISSAMNTSYVTSGTIILSSLSALTTYYYNITICDQAANCHTNGTYNFTTSASSDGGLGGGGGGGGGTVTTECSSDWVCTGWGSCSKSGEKTRSCTDVNDCGEESPSESASCIYVLPAKPKEKKKAEEVPATQTPAVIETTQKSELDLATVKQPVPEAVPAPITGKATIGNKLPVITLKTGWWLLAFLVILVILIITITERKKHREIAPPLPPKR